MPHIYGATRDAVMFGTGYAGAEDRLFLMDVLRHTGRAQLSSFAGGADSNREMDRLQWEIAPYTEADLQKQIDDAPKIYGAQGTRIIRDGQQYIAGINQRIQEDMADPNKLPAEYPALQIVPQKWVPADLVWLNAGAGQVHRICPGLSTGLACGRTGDPLVLRRALVIGELPPAVLRDDLQVLQDVPLQPADHLPFPRLDRSRDPTYGRVIELVALEPVVPRITDDPLQELGVDRQLPVELREPAPPGKGLLESGGIALAVEEDLGLEPDRDVDGLQAQGEVRPERIGPVGELSPRHDAAVRDGGSLTLIVVVDVRAVVTEEAEPLTPPPDPDVPEEVLLGVRVRVDIAAVGDPDLVVQRERFGLAHVGEGAEGHQDPIQRDLDLRLAEAEQSVALVVREEVVGLDRAQQVERPAPVAL